MNTLRDRVVGNEKFLVLGTMIFMLCWLGFGCATTPNHQSAQGNRVDTNPPGPYRPAVSHEIEESFPAAEGGLPLGIRGSFDLFVSEAAKQLADVYNDVLKPLQKGKIFRRQPYELDYAILPNRGDIFNHTGRLDSANFRSDYSFRIGMVRRFQDWTDFLNPNFWLAKGEYDPTNISSNHLTSLWLANENANSLDLDKNLHWDLNEITGAGWEEKN